MRIAGFIRLMPAHRGVGGMQGHALILYSQLAKRGHDVHVFTTSHPDKKAMEVESGIKVHYLPGTPPSIYSGEYFEASFRKFTELNKKQKFDVIHSESNCARRLIGHAVPSVVTWHGIGYCGFRSKINEFMARGKPVPNTMFNNGFTGVVKERREISGYDVHVAISDQAYDDLNVMYEIPKARLRLVFNGFDSKQFAINQAAGQKFRKKHGIPVNAKVLGAGGRLEVDKGHRTLIKALRKILSRNPNLFVLVVGKGACYNEYKRIGHQRIKLVGAVPYGEMPAAYNAMDVFCNPTLRYLGLDMTMQEAMLCGLPVVATDTGSIKKSLITNDDFGFTHELGAHDELAALVTRALSSKFNPEKISQHIRSFCTVEKMTQGMEEAFQVAISMRGKK